MGTLAEADKVFEGSESESSLKSHVQYGDSRASLTRVLISGVRGICAWSLGLRLATVDALFSAAFFV